MLFGPWLSERISYLWTIQQNLVIYPLHIYWKTKRSNFHDWNLEQKLNTLLRSAFIDRFLANSRCFLTFLETLCVRTVYSDFLWIKFLYDINWSCLLSLHLHFAMLVHQVSNSLALIILKMRKSRGILSHKDGILHAVMKHIISNTSWKTYIVENKFYISPHYKLIVWVDP